MKFKILSMLFTLGVLSILPMIYMGKFDPMAFFDGDLNASVSDFEKLQNQAPKGLTTVVTDKKVQVYKWRDEYGVMQFSNTPPASGAAEQVVLNPDSNLMQAVKVPEKEAAQEQVEVEAPNPYSVRGMKKVMDDAKGVEDLLQKRHEEQLKMMQNL